jgi:putative salt-induced outer membrane protein YdiY
VNRFSTRIACVSSDTVLVTVLVVSSILGVAVARAEDTAEKKLGWFFKASSGWVWLGGNSESNSFTFGGETRRVWENSELLLKAGGTQTQSSLKTRTAVGTVNDYIIRETKHTEKTAELYYARTRYDYNVSKYFFAFGGADWLRNTFAGIDNRELVALGAGNAWVDRNDLRFKTDYGVTYTFEQAVIENPFIKSDFPGARMGYEFSWKFAGTTELSSAFVADWNLDNTKDIRIDCKSELPVSISNQLKLKPTLEFLWRNDPALTEVELFDTGGTPTGVKIRTPLQELDTIFTVSLVFEM